MYESPIEIIYGQLQTQLDGDIFRAVQKADILVNKEELTKALQYDRDQYDKGYADGIRVFAERLKEDFMEYKCGATLGYIDHLVEEMTGEGE